MPFPSIDRSRRTFLSCRTVGELALNGDQGIHSVGQVQATYAYCLPDVPDGKTGEIARWTKIRMHAYRQLLADLHRHAEALGADAVLAAQFHFQPREWAKGLVEVVASGTAVVGDPVVKEGVVLVTTLTAGEVYALRQAGYRPLGCTVGVFAYRQKARESVAKKLGIGANGSLNGEHTDFSSGLDKARRSAISRMEQGTQTQGATDIIGVSVAMEMHPETTGSSQKTTIEQMVFTLTAIGIPVVSERPVTPVVSYALPLDI